MNYEKIVSRNVETEEKDELKEKEITKTWISGQNSCTMIIPRSVAKEYGLESPSHVIVERTPEGILIRKLDLHKGENY
jgi:bifunctional DNA-binding transcriptional regulator/antitoxin component of YhaV-PrlF toxin-antitoxin module